MLPSDTKGRKLAAIYVEKNSTPEAREVQVLYEGDFIFSASPTPSTEDQEIQHFKQVVNQPGSTFPNYVTIHGHPGCGTGPNITEGPFGKHQNPGSLVWWEDGITYSVIAPGVELNDLINIAESTKLQ